MKFCTHAALQKEEPLRLIFLILILFPFHLSAEILRTNPDHSEILFQIPYLKLSEVTGRFKDFSGELVLNEKDIPSKVKINIDSDSIDTGNKLRDSHLKGFDFLDSKAHPLIRFESDEIIPFEKSFTAVGVLSFLGKSRPLKIQFTLSEVLTDTWSKKSRFAKFDLKLSRKELGLKWNKTLPENEFLLGDEVHVWGSLQLQLAGELTHPTKHMIPDTPYAREREKVLRGEKPVSEISASGSSVSTPTQSLEAKSPELVLEKNIETASERSLLWWISFCILGLMGFFSTIIISVAFKRWVHQRTRVDHSETGVLGLLSDVFVIVVVFIYALSLWEVGWG